MSHYPDYPGSNGPDGTSQDAAKAIAPSVRKLRHIAMLALDRLGEATRHEAAADAGVKYEAIQPRFSELKKMGLVESTGKRRLNPSGKSAAVLRLTAKGRAALQLICT